MKIIACLCWYNESAAWLAGALASACRFCDHVVAVDGAYALFPEGRPASSTEEHDAVRETVIGAGKGLTLHVPNELWNGQNGGEVTKRAHMFHMAMEIAEPGVDWVFVLDGDDIVREVPSDLRQKLEETDRHVGGVNLVTHYDAGRWSEVGRKMSIPTDTQGLYFRKLFRALPGLTVKAAHWVYVAENMDGLPVCLWGPEWLDPEEVLDVNELVVEHRSEQRPMYRSAQTRAYYQTRDAMAVEGHSRVYMEGLDGELAFVR